MREFILVNSALLQRNAVYEVIEIEKVYQLIIPVSRILAVKSLEKNITRDVMNDKARNQVRNMSLSYDTLGGSTVIYMDEDGRPKYVTTLETPEAIYDQMYSE